VKEGHKLEVLGNKRHRNVIDPNVSVELQMRHNKEHLLLLKDFARRPIAGAVK
jgi:hypothetical protein